MGGELGLTRVVGREGPGQRHDSVAYLQGEVRRGSADHLGKLGLGRHRIRVLSDAHAADVATGAP